MRALCIWNSQPPPKAKPRTAETTGTSAYLMRWLVAWKLATIASNASTLPACKRPSAPAKSAPAENGSFGCQITMPLNFDSAMPIASCRPSSTASLTVCILVLKLATATSSPSVHRRMPSFSNTVSPGAKRSPSSGSGKRWRLYTGSAERGSLASLAGL